MPYVARFGPVHLKLFVFPFRANKRKCQVKIFIWLESQAKGNAICLVTLYKTLRHGIIYIRKVTHITISREKAMYREMPRELIFFQSN